MLITLTKASVSFCNQLQLQAAELAGIQIVQRCMLLRKSLLKQPANEGALDFCVHPPLCLTGTVSSKQYKKLKVKLTTCLVSNTLYIYSVQYKY